MGRATVSLVVVLCWTVYLSVTASAQQTNVVCLAEYNWFNNLKGQSPCFVAAELIAQCDPSRANVTALHSGGLDYYSGPDGTIGFFPTDCTCNTVMYSLFSACSVCQGYRYIEWSRWVTNCRSVYIAHYPKAIPDATAVPAWAYLNVAANGNNFSIAAAAANTNLPDVTSSSTTSSAIPVAPPATSTPIVPTEVGGTNAGSSSANFIRNRTTTIIIPVVIVGGLFLTAVIGFTVHLRNRWRLRRHRTVTASQGDAGVATVERGETQTSEVTREGPISTDATKHGVRTNDALLSQPTEEADSSEIQLVSRENDDIGPSVRRSVGSRVAFRLDHEEPVAGPSRITLNS